MNSLLIIGKRPLPIGGVTIHVERLIIALEKEGFKFEFYDLKKFRINSFLKKILNSKCIHLHSSSPFLRFFFSLFCKIINKKTIVTFHGNLGRYGSFLNTIDKLSVFFCYVPIVLNNLSLDKARHFNKRTRKISAFIHPSTEPIFNTSDLLQEIHKFKSRFSFIYCTNAFKMNYNQKNEEIYGVLKLFEIFKNKAEYGLIISDPSGEYKQYFHQKCSAIPHNILVIDYPHSFIEVLKECNAFLRTTITDGDSLSVLEALSLKKIVIASDCVDRPSGVILYKTNDMLDLQLQISRVAKEKIIVEANYEDGLKKLIELYNSLN